MVGSAAAGLRAARSPPARGWSTRRLGDRGTGLRAAGGVDHGRPGLRPSRRGRHGRAGAGLEGEFTTEGPPGPPGAAVTAGPLCGPPGAPVTFGPPFPAGAPTTAGPFGACPRGRGGHRWPSGPGRRILTPGPPRAPAPPTRLGSEGTRSPDPHGAPTARGPLASGDGTAATEVPDERCSSQAPPPPTSSSASTAAAITGPRREGGAGAADVGRGAAAGMAVRSAGDGHCGAGAGRWGAEARPGGAAGAAGMTGIGFPQLGKTCSHPEAGWRSAGGTWVAPRPL